jgi:hypothetical protein
VPADVDAVVGPVPLCGHACCVCAERRDAPASWTMPPSAGSFSKLRRRETMTHENLDGR